MRIYQLQVWFILVIVGIASPNVAEDDIPSNTRVLDALNGTEWIYELDSARIDATIRTTRPPETVELNRKSFVKGLRDIGVEASDEIPEEIAREQENFKTSSVSTLTLAWDRKRLMYRIDFPNCLLDIAVWDGLAGRTQRKSGSRQNSFSLQPNPPHAINYCFGWLPWAMTADHCCPLQIDADGIAKLEIQRSQNRKDESELRFHSVVDFGGTQCELYARPTIGSWERVYVEQSTGRLRGVRMGSWGQVYQAINFPIMQKALTARGIDVTTVDEAEQVVMGIAAKEKEKFLSTISSQSEAAYWEHVPDLDPIWTVVLNDWREVLPGRLFPFRQERHTHPGGTTRSTGEEHQITSIVRFDVNQPLDDTLLVLTIDEGADVYDATHDPPLRFKQDSERTPSEWATLIAKARESKADNEATEQAMDAFIGTAAPQFPKTNWLNSEPLNWEQLAGKYVLLDFWHVGCGPCWGYIGWMQTLHVNRGTTEGLVAIGVHGAGIAPEAIRDELANRIKYDVTFPICIDLPLEGDVETDTYPSQFFSRCGIRQMPYGWLVGPDGKLIAHGDPPELVDKARELIRSSRDK